GADDVPFRSVASRLVKGLSDRHRDDFRLDVLRPPTFARLAEVLRQAAADGQPYHIVHFDGHGVYEASGARFPRGYLRFETDAPGDNAEKVNGTLLGSLLVETDVPVLVLNACRSARADPAQEPVEATTDAHEQVR